jgi:hypothetical protein
LKLRDWVRARDAGRPGSTDKTLQISESLLSELPSVAVFSYSKGVNDSQKEMIWSYTANGETFEYRLQNDFKDSGLMELEFINSALEKASSKMGIMELLDYKYELVDQAMESHLIHQNNLFESNIPDEMKGVILDVLQGDFAEQFIGDGYVFENLKAFKEQQNAVRKSIDTIADL